MKKLLCTALIGITLFGVGCGKSKVDEFTIEDSQAVISKYSDIIGCENFVLKGMINSELEPITIHPDGIERNFLAYRFLWEHGGVTDEIYLISDGHDFKYGDRVELESDGFFGEDDELGMFMIFKAGDNEAISIAF